MPVADHKIKNLKTFNAVTNSPRQIARLYKDKVLDCLVELAYKVSKDAFSRLHLYTNLGDPTLLVNLSNMWGKYGSDPLFPSKSQREAVYAPLFGSADGSTSAFVQLRDELGQAVIAFVENVFTSSEAVLRERVRITHRDFKENFLLVVEGDTLTFYADDILSKLTEDVAYKILRNRGVAAVFGIATPPGANSPYDTDPNLSKLVEEISKQLNYPDETGQTLSRQEFSNLQTVALRGAEALATSRDVTDDSTDAEVDLLSRKVYSWVRLLEVTPSAYVA